MKGLTLLKTTVICLSLIGMVSAHAGTSVLWLRLDSESGYVQPGETVGLDLVLFLSELTVNGFQGVFSYNTLYFQDPAGGCVTEKGYPWDLLIWDSWRNGNGVPGKVDAAIGLDALGATGTGENNVIAQMVFTARTQEGITNIRFRSDVSDVESTILADITAQPVYPWVKFNSTRIFIDGTPPLVNILSATQNSSELLGAGAPNAIQGNVLITVEASDTLAGLDGLPTVTVTPQGGAAEDITASGVDNGAGTFSYTYTVTPATPNGTAVIDVLTTDMCGNLAEDSEPFTINKNRITGTVELESLNPPSSGIQRTVTFKATDTGGTLLKTWNISVYFAGGTSAGSYILNNVPGNTAGLSAKTNWNLRRKNSVVFDGDNQASIAFSGFRKLLGGDLNSDNMIQLWDYNILKTNWFTTNNVADINGDGMVQLWDYNIMKNNWFTIGETQ